MALQLIKSPIYDDGTTVVNAIPAASQVFFKVQRDDLGDTLHWTVQNNAGKARFVMDATPSGTAVGDLFYIADREIAPAAAATYRGLHRITAISSNIWDTDTNYINTNNDGVMTFQRLDIYTLSALLKADTEAYPDTIQEYKIPFSSPIFAFSLAEAFRPLWSIDQLYMTASVTITATQEDGISQSGSAIGTFDLQLFGTYVPQGYQYGANLAGYVLRPNLLGTFLTQMGKPRLFNQFKTWIGIYVDQVWPIQKSLMYRVIDINGNPLNNFFPAGFPYPGLGIKPISLLPTSISSGGVAYEMYVAEYDPPAYTPLTEVVTYEYVIPCAGEVILGWLNKLGGLEYYNFSIWNEGQVRSTPGLAYEIGGTFDLQDNVDTRRQSVGSTRQRYTLTAQNIDRSNIYALGQIAASPLVFIQTYNPDLDETQRVRVEVLEGMDLPYSVRDQKAHKMRLVIQLPEDSAPLDSLLSYPI